MYLAFDNGEFMGLYATYEDAISPSVAPIINPDGSRGLPHGKIEAENYHGLNEDDYLWEVKHVHEPHRI